MKKINTRVLLAVSLLLLAFPTFARSGQGVDAVGVCMEMNYSFDSDADECIKALRNADYIQSSAARICGSLSFDSDTTSCLRTIMNKEFTSSEINFCSDKTFSSDTIACFRDNGQAYTGEVSDSQRLQAARITAEKLKQELSNGQLLRALSTLDDLLWILQ